MYLIFYLFIAYIVVLLQYYDFRQLLKIGLQLICGVLMKSIKHDFQKLSERRNS